MSLSTVDRWEERILPLLGAKEGNKDRESWENEESNGRGRKKIQEEEDSVQFKLSKYVSKKFVCY